MQVYQWLEQLTRNAELSIYNKRSWSQSFLSIINAHGQGWYTAIDTGFSVPHLWLVSHPRAI